MIYEKNSAAFPANENSNRYSQTFEYMFIFSKGKPKTANLLIDKKNRWAGTENFGVKTDRNKKGELDIKNKFTVKENSARNNIWRYNTGYGNSTKDLIAYKHPAIFPEELVADHLKTWSIEGDLVYDPFGGSGTTSKVAHLLKRNWIISEISKDYGNEIAQIRMNKYLNQGRLF